MPCSPPSLSLEMSRAEVLRTHSCGHGDVNDENLPPGGQKRALTFVITLKSLPPSNSVCLRTKRGQGLGTGLNYCLGLTHGDSDSIDLGRAPGIGMF